MRPCFKGAHGHTLTELLIASGTLVTVLAMTLGGWSYVMRGERRHSTQCELDMQVRMATERLRSELRISSVEKMFFHPPGLGPYTAVSFPVARDLDGDGLVDMMDGDRYIDWGETVVYHIAKGSPDQLLRTSFVPRDNTLTPEQRAEQLAAVVADGHGADTHNGANSTTRVLFSNFFDWTIDPKNLMVDAYNPGVARRFVAFGSALLQAGDHDYRFTVLGKNALSSGYKLGLDTLRVSPTSLNCEAEDQTILAGTAHASRQAMPEGSWGGNHHLLFDTGAGSDALPLTLRIPYDRWEERNFDALGVRHERTRVSYDGTAGNYALQLTGKGEAWNAVEQTGSPEIADDTVDFDGLAVRLLIRGDDPERIGYIRHDGRITSAAAWTETLDGVSQTLRPAVYLRLPMLVYIAATIGVADPAGAATLDVVPGTVKALSLQREGSSHNVLGMVATGLANQIPISRTNSYVVSIRFPEGGTPGYLPVWSNVVDAAVISTVTIPGASAADLSAASWAGRTGLVAHPNLHGLRRLVTAYPADGHFTSQIVDTKIDGAVYDRLAVDRACPTGTDTAVKFRTGAQPDLSDTAGWGSISEMADGASLASFEGRYAQFRARLASDTLGVLTPRLSRVAASWPGVMQLVEVGAVITVGPDYGVFSVKVDDQPLVKGLRVKLSIFKNVPGTPSQLTSSMTMEVEPRNSGK